MIKEQAGKEKKPRSKISAPNVDSSSLYNIH